ncbi:MAG: hypothetical protein JO227_15100 [Acetobacteraceae bacterium]|nr:hypothetical protein [Acetobacteraceae bacterium]
MIEPNPTNHIASAEAWPALPFDQWRESCRTLHMWTQVVGKIRLAHAPMINHWWQVTLYVTCRGLTTSPIPYGHRAFQIDFDFIEHRLKVHTSDGATETIPLAAYSVADFYSEVTGRLRGLGLDTRIWTMPVEIDDAIPFEQDRTHASYDSEYATLFWRVLIQVERVFTQFRSRFLGKVSPVHFFWGSFDMAVTRFSGRGAPLLAGTSPHLGAWVMQEAYSHEVSSCGFWPGDDGFGQAAFYSYTYPEPAGFADARIRPEAAFYHEGLGQFILPYDAVRGASSPDDYLMDFLQTTYEAAATTGQWDRSALERADRC